MYNNAWNLTDETIKKFDLELTDKTYNDSFVKEVRIFKWPHLDAYEAYFMECDYNGEVDRLLYLIIAFEYFYDRDGVQKKFGFRYLVSKEYLEQIEKDIAIKSIQEEYSEAFSKAQ